MSDRHHIAIVGMAARFPGAADLDQYWANLRDGVESVQFPTDDELRAYGVSEEMLRHPDYVKAVATAPGVQDFDSALFGYTPKEADFTDPQIRMFLESAHAALEHSGYDPYREEATIAVYGSAGTNRYVDNLGLTGDAAASTSFALTSLNNTDYVAITAAYKMNLRGAAISVSTACSSSLVAVHLASQALRNGECDLAVAGGAEVEMPFGHGYLWTQGSPFSRDGHVRPFDGKADGTLFSTGAGAVVLKRLSDALADGDTVHAVLRGTALNNDGSAKAGFTAPSVIGQATMLAEAFAMAEVTANELAFVECHATGTPLGDPIEVAALHRALQAVGDNTGTTVALGSVKSSIGHLGHAAGIASLIKGVLALRHGALPGTVNFQEANPKLHLDRTPFVIADRLTPLTQAPGVPLVGGVSSFGVGGTNAHVVIEEPPARVPQPVRAQPRIVVWSAQSEVAGRQYQENLARYFTDHDPQTFPAAVRTLQHGRRPYPLRSAIVADDPAVAAERLAADDGVLRGAGAERRDLVFAFPGQGSQRAGMGHRLYREDKAFAEAMDEVLVLFGTHGIEVREDWLSGDPERLTGTVATQASLFAVEYALVCALRARGVRPGAVLGHSVGELAAAVTAGVFSLADGVALVAARARAMSAVTTGAMLAVAAPLDDLPTELLAGLTVAVVNEPRQVVLSGSRDDVLAARSALQSRKILATVLPTAGAFHSPLMIPAAVQFAAAFDGVELSAPTIPFYSAAAGGLIGEDQAVDPDFWADQVAGVVRYDRAVAAVLADGPRRVLEVGPGRVLSDLGRGTGGPGSSFTPALPRTDTDLAGLLAVVARLWVDGHDVEWPEPDDAGPVRRVPLPGYPYQRRRHWVDAPALTTPPAVAAVPAVEAALPVNGEPTEAGTPLSTVVWTETQALPRSAVSGLCLLLAPASEADSLPVVLAVQQAGAAVAIARPAEAYAEVGAEFRIRPGSRVDLDRVLAALAGRGTPVTLVVHAFTAGPNPALTSAGVNRAVEAGFTSLFVTAQTVAALPAGGAAGLLVLTRGAVDVTGAEPLDPTAAMLVGFARSLAKEAPELGCRVVDVALPADHELACELGQWRRHEVVALRGTRRWVPTQVAFDAAPWESPSPLRRQGVYLITGGTGGLGMALARGLAGTGLQPRLILLSRTGLDDDATDERSERLRAQLAEITGLGAQVRVLTGDVADRRGLRRALDVTVSRFGPVNGVFHLAGLPGDGLVRLREPDDVAAVLSPKVRGTVVLDEALRSGPPLDFFACFSSRAAHDGLVGSADYAAANAFQDAYAVTLRRAGVPAVSINWPSWAEVGMAAEYGVRTWSTTIGPALSPIMDEHRLEGAAILPGTGQLDLMLRGYCELTGRDLPVRLTDVVYHQVLATEDERRVEIRLHTDGTLESWSRSGSDPGAPAVRHASARVAAAGEPGGPRPIGELRSSFTHELMESEADGPRLFHLGRRWDNTVATWTRTPEETSELLVQLRLPEEFADDLAVHPVHPTLLDSASTAFRRPDDGFHLPFCCESIVFHGRLPAEVFVHVRRKPSGPGVIRADLELLGFDGQPLCVATGYTLRQIQPGTKVTAPAGGGESGAADGIPPRLGVALTLAILGARHPGQVLVESNAQPLRGRETPERPGPTAPVVDQRPTAVASAAAAEALADTVAGMASAGPAAATAGPGDANSLESRMKALWVEAIGDPDIGMDVDFFSVGGNSLTAIALISAIRETFQVELSIGAIFDYPTIAALATLLREQGLR